ncbi:MAG: PrgI family protein [bacterium]|nr:PrgI family protein [bacterium]
MTQHPIPRDIASFKFKLVGNMTVSQFAMLSGWIIVAYALYLTPLPNPIKLPFVLLATFLAFAFPFLPIEERPLHHWILAFLKAAFFTELRRVWKKAAAADDLFALPLNRLAPVIAKQTISPPVSTETPPPSTVTMQGVQTTVQTAPTIPPSLTPTPSMTIPPIPPQPQPIFIPRPQTSPPPIPTDRTQKTAQEIIQEASLTHMVKTGDDRSDILHTQNAHLEKIIQKLETDLGDVRNQQQQSFQQKTALTDTVTLLQQQLAGAIGQREHLNRQLYSLQESPRPLAGTAATSTPQRVVIMQPQPSMSMPKPAVPSTMPAQPSGVLPQLTTIPNAINGIVRGKQSEFLSDVIVVIKDQAGLPARALKTNRLGQFVVSTPLPNGTYFVELEKEGYTFDTIEVQVTGRVLGPITIQVR